MALDPGVSRTRVQCSRSQYARRQVGRPGRVIATDMLPRSQPLPGCTFVQGDSSRARGLLGGPLVALAGGARRGHAFLSDMAPNLSGVDVIDQPRAMHLAELALEFGRRAGLEAAGAASLIKVFQGAGFDGPGAKGSRVPVWDG